MFVSPPARALVTRLGTSWVAPQATGAVVDRAMEARAATGLAESLRGRITWSSNRSGNHELYMLRLPSAEVVQLTDHAHVDFGARFSPDGTSLVFMRSRREWVSFREPDGWDVMLLDLATGQERRLIRRGHHPTWGRDGGSVVFIRGKQVLESVLATGEEKVLFDSELVADGREIGDAELHPDGSQLALAVSRYGAIVLPPSAAEFVRLTQRHVCQTTWVPDSNDLLWMQSEGNGGTRVMRGAADGSRAEIFMDLPGDRSHEYFPKLAKGGAWLVWGAAAEGHEHDRADYEIYAWRVGQAWETAVRLTYFAGNDQWPDIYVD